MQSEPLLTEYVAKLAAAGSIPVKYTYQGSGAATHIEYSSTSDYRDAVWGIGGIVRLLASDHNWRSFRTLVDLGSGTGLMAAALLLRCEALRSVQNYLAVDNSAELLAFAIENVSCLNRNFHTDGLRADFEEGIVSFEGCRHLRPLIFLLLGNTLGNVENIDATLNNIWSTFKAGDIGIFSVAKIPTEADAQKLIEPYRSKQFALAAAQPLVSIGIPVENLDFRVEWNSAFNYIEGIHTIKRTHRIAVRGDDRNFIELISGHEVRTFLSRRFDVDTISGHLERSGYRILKSMDVRAEGALHLLVDVAGG